METYKVIQQPLAAIFAADIGRTQEEEDRLFQESLKNDVYRTELGFALEKAFNDSSFS